jgi:hypothetical protein
MSSCRFKLWQCMLYVLILAILSYHTCHCVKIKKLLLLLLLHTHTHTHMYIHPTLVLVCRTTVITVYISTLYRMADYSVLNSQDVRRTIALKLMATKPVKFRHELFNQMQSAVAMNFKHEWLCSILREGQPQMLLYFWIGKMQTLSRGSSVSIVSDYGMDDRAFEIRYPAEVKGFFL